VDFKTLYQEQKKILANSALTHLAKKPIPDKKHDKPSDLSRSGISPEWIVYEVGKEKIPVHTHLQAKLLDAVSNNGMDATVVAEIIEDPLKGAKVIGNARFMIENPNPVWVEFHTLSINGTETAISAYALGSHGETGLSAKVDLRLGSQFLKLIGDTAGAILSLSSYKNDIHGLGGRVYETTVGKTLKGLPYEPHIWIEAKTDFRLVFRKSAEIPKG